MLAIHQRSQKISNDDDTFSKSTQNSLPWVLPDKYITDCCDIGQDVKMTYFLE